MSTAPLGCASRAPHSLLALVLLLSACAPGPGGGPGSGPGGGMGGPRGAPMGMMAMEEVPRDAATIALRFQHELALSDSQVSAFSAIRAQLAVATEPLRKQLDTLVVDPRSGANETADDRTRTQARLRARAGIVRQLKEQVQDVRAVVLLALSERQRSQMQIFEDAMKDDARPTFGGPGGGGPGGRGGGGRPGGGRPPGAKSSPAQLPQ